MARKKKGGHAEGHGNSERWLLTYADMITLLMAFFIMMYSMSVMNLQKFNEVAISIRSGFGGVLKGAGPHIFTHPAGKRSIRPEAMYSPNMDAQAKRAATQMRSFVIEENLDKDVQVTEEVRGVVISMAAENLLFRRGSAELTPQASVLLTKVKDILNKSANEVQVEGHTCPLPIRSSAFPSNWELSSARASRVVRFLAETGISSTRLSAVGMADTRPRVPNSTEENRAKNRRVDIVIMSSEAPAIFAGKIPASAKGTGGHKRTIKDVARPKTVSISPEINKVWTKDEQVHEEAH